MLSQFSFPSPQCYRIYAPNGELKMSPIVAKISIEVSSSGEYMDKVIQANGSVLTAVRFSLLLRQRDFKFSFFLLEEEYTIFCFFLLQPFRSLSHYYRFYLSFIRSRWARDQNSHVTA